MPTLTSNRGRRRARRSRRSPLPAVILSVALATAAIALVSWLLWPTWTPQKAGDPSEIPVSVGNTLFNVPAFAMRRKVQRHSGTQERIDLDFAYPSLGPPAAPRRVTAQTAEEEAPPIDVLFLSIALADDTVTPDERARSIYPRYLDSARAAESDGLSLMPFRDGTPYANEDLAVSQSSALVARCSRDAMTPGMCLSERRIEGADLTFRFPRSWLAQWREVAGAMDRLIARIHRPHR
jgi:hypothetical protein